MANIVAPEQSADSEEGCDGVRRSGIGFVGLDGGARWAHMPCVGAAYAFVQHKYFDDMQTYTRVSHILIEEG